MRRAAHRPMPERLPPALRCFLPKLKRGTVGELALVHLIELDTLAKGQATAQTLWGWAGGVLAWSRVAEDLQRGVDDMAKMLNLAGCLLDRLKRTDQVQLEPGEYELARHGVDVMDALAELVDKPTATRAMDWATACINALRAEAEEPRCIYPACQHNGCTAACPGAARSAGGASGVTP